MYIATIFPTKENHTINIPEEFYGKEILLTAQTVVASDHIKFADKLADVESLFSKYRKIDMSGFKFNREEANNFDE